jgi:O-antigen/teichoic acid export membrane protein
VRLTKAASSDWTWSAGGLAVMTLGGLFANALIARQLSRDDVGVFFLCMSTVAVLSLVGRLGLDYAVVRDTAAYRARSSDATAHSVIRAMLRITAVASAVTALLTAVMLMRLNPSGGAENSLGSLAVVVIVALTVFAESLRQVASESFRGLGSIRMATLLGPALRSAVLLALVAAAVALGFDLSLLDALGVALAASLITCATALLLVSAHLPREVAPSAYGLVRIGQSFPIMLSSLAGIVLSQGAVLVCGIVESPGNTALFGAALRVSLLLEAPLFVANSVLMPRIAHLWAISDRRALQSLLRTTSTISSLPMLLALVLIYAFGGPILNLIFGPGFEMGAAALAILATGQLVSSLAGSCGVTLTMSGNHALAMRISLLVGALSGASQYALGSAFGIVGVAAGSAAGLAGVNVLAAVAVRRQLGITSVADPSVAWQLLRRGLPRESTV